MSLRLADDTIIDLGTEVLQLRPSLRAAYLLHRRYGGFASMINAIHEGNVSVMADIIDECSSGHNLLLGLLNDGEGRALGTVIEKLVAPLASHVAKLAGHDDDATDAPSSGKAVPYEEHFASLFSFATGWLDWSPDDALNATPTQIMLAQRGKMQMLKAIYGDGKSEDKEAIDLTKGRMEQSAKDRLNAIGNMTNHRMPS